MEENNRKKLGVIGGLGPMTTVVFLEMLIHLTKADTDQEHIPVVIEHLPAIPDRTAYILKKSDESPVPAMTAAGKRLSACGATEIAIPCFTAHYFHDELQESVDIPIINGIEETARWLRRCGVNTAGVMATDGTLSTHLFEEALAKEGIKAVVPDREHQAMVMSLIYDYVKADRPCDPALFYKVKSHLNEAGAETVILGCTELSVLAKSLPDTTGLTDALLILARRCVEDFGTLRENV